MKKESILGDQPCFFFFFLKSKGIQLANRPTVSHVIRVHVETRRAICKKKKACSVFINFQALTNAFFAQNAEISKNTKMFSRRQIFQTVMFFF